VIDVRVVIIASINMKGAKSVKGKHSVFTLAPAKFYLHANTS